MKTSKLMCWISVCLLASVVAGAAAPNVVMANDRRVEGTQIRALPDGEIRLTTQQGIRSFARGQYKEAVADKPAEFDQAVAALRGKKHADAIRLLEGIATKYRFLKWDAEALKLLPDALIATGKHEEAIRAYDRLFQVAPHEKQNSAVVWGKRRTMLAAKQYAALTRELDMVAASGSRPDAARAQTMRGDIQMAQNDLTQAAMDYLRTAVMFQDVKDPEIQGEAHFKAAQALESLRDPDAKAMYRRLVNNYPQSPYAAQAKSKL